MTADFVFGFQGWDHAEWIGTWYPPFIESSAMLGEYSKRFSTVEVDDTFYGIPPEPVVRSWRDSVPANFSFAPKAPQQVTHEQRFSGQGGLLKRFLDRVSLLEEKLGPILLVAPPGFEPDDANSVALRGYVKELSADFRWALELKHVGWFTDEIHDLLASKNVAIVSGENRWISRSSMLDLMKRPTADFAYVRWNHRLRFNPAVDQTDSKERVSGNWPETLATLGSLVDTVFGFFNINAYGNGMRSAEELQRAIGQQRLDTSASGRQRRP